MAETKLVIMSGPHDGAVHALERKSYLVSASPEADVRITCDPDLPNPGVGLSVEDEGVVYEDRASGELSRVAFGVPYLVGQTLLSVYRDAGSERDAPGGIPESREGEAV